jgi:hypothetical protein
MKSCAAYRPISPLALQKLNQSVFLGGAVRYHTTARAKTGSSYGNKQQHERGLT